MGNNSTLQNSSEMSQIVLYQPEETISIEVKLDAEHDTVWLSQAQMADLYGTQRQAITKHIKIYITLMNYNAKKHVPFWN